MMPVDMPCYPVVEDAPSACAFADVLQVGLCVVRRDRFLYVNPYLAAMLGQDPQEMVSDMAAHEILDPADRSLVDQRVARRSRGESTEACDVRLVGRHGAIDVRVEARRIRFRGESADLVTLHDITEARSALLAAARRAALLDLTEELCLGGSADVDLATRRGTVSDGLRQLVGIQEAPGSLGIRALLAHVLREDRARVLQAWREAVPGQPFLIEHRVRRAGGDLRQMHHRGLLERRGSGGLPRAVVVLQDVTARSEAEHLLAEARCTDPITGLLNRAGLLERLDPALEETVWEHAVLMALDVPQLQQVKQALGMAAGDAFAASIARRLRAQFGLKGLLARLTDSTFAVALAGAGEDTHEVARAALAGVRVALADPEFIQGREIFPTYFAGVSRSPDDGRSAGDLLLEAMRAMRDAETEGQDTARYASAARTASHRRGVAIEWALHQAVVREELHLVYQPQVSLRDGRVCGVEALVRWHSPSLGEVEPAEFIPIAERCGQIAGIGDWVLRTACRQAAAWAAEGLPPVRVHVNVSVAQFERGDLAERVQMALLEAGIEPGRLGIEVTEGVLSIEASVAARTLADLRTIGVEISLDDFGTGRSHLARLRELAIDTIKVDRSLIADIVASSHEVSVSRAIIDMAHGLRMRVVAEGVETQVQLQQLIHQRCDAIQGFHFCEPLDADGVAAVLREGRGLPPELVGGSTRQRTLLLVDDEPNILASLRRSLRRGGYRILTANSGQEGLECLAREPIDVIVSDQRMPGMTGVEFLRQAKELNPDSVRMVLSGYTELQSITDAINEGAIYKFLTKPWEDDLLRANIDEAFRQKEMADDNRRLEAQVRAANADLGAANRRLEIALAAQREAFDVVEDRSLAAMDLLTIAPFPLVGIDAEDCIVFFNDAARELLPALAAAFGQVIRSLPDTLAGLLPGATDASDSVVAIEGRRFDRRVRSFDQAGSQRGRLVVFFPSAA